MTILDVFVQLFKVALSKYDITHTQLPENTLSSKFGALELYKNMNIHPGLLLFLLFIFLELLQVCDTKIYFAPQHLECWSIRPVSMMEHLRILRLPIYQIIFGHIKGISLL